MYLHRHLHRIRGCSLGLFLSSLMFMGITCEEAYAEDDQVIVVPFSQQNLQLPHPAHEGAPITLKAIIRNARCGTYQIQWDINRTMQGCMYVRL